MMTLLRRWGSGARCLMLAGALFVAGCGGDTGGVGVGGTGLTITQIATDSTPVAVATPVPVTVSGPITGFGSVIVNGLKFDDTLADVLRDAITISNSNLRLGMTIEVTGTRNADGITGSASTIKVFSEMKGPVQSVQAGAGSLSVLGVKVTVDSSTVFEGAGDLSAVKAGDAVEVYGLRNPSTGDVLATRVEVEPVTANSGPVTISLSGSISALNTAARTFVLNGQTVQYGSAMVTGSLASGVKVQVTGSVPSGGGNVTATTVAVQATSSLTEGQTMEFSGIVTDFVSRTQFRINALPIDAGSNSLAASEILKLQNGTRCEVKGRVRNGVIVASELECKSSSATATVYEVSGTITAFVSASNFTLRNQTIDASQASFSGGALANLALGKKVTVKGPVVGGVLKATTVEFGD